MPKSFQTLAYVLAVLAVLAFLLSWKFFISPDPVETSSDYQAGLKATAANVFAPADTSEGELRIYAVNIVRKVPFKSPFIGYGIYLGQGTVLTAAHVIGHWPSYARLRVIIAGQDLPAKVIKYMSPDDTDLALISVDAERLPISLRLRRNPFCKGPTPIGATVVVVYPEKSVRSQTISPLFVAPQFRSRFPTLITEPQGSGSGVFSADRKCLLGILSRRVTKYVYKNEGPFRVARPNGWAGYFVPVSALSKLQSSSPDHGENPPSGLVLPKRSRSGQN
jgi:trypsin-like peptidase